MIQGKLLCESVVLQVWSQKSSLDQYLEIEDFYFALHDNTVGGWWVLSIVYCQDGVESCIEICRVRRCKKRDQGVLKSYKNKLN